LAYSSEQTTSVSTIAELDNFDPEDFEMLPPDGVLLIASWLDAFDRTRPKKVVSTIWNSFMMKSSEEKTYLVKKSIVFLLSRVSQRPPLDNTSLFRGHAANVVTGPHAHVAHSLIMPLLSVLNHVT
jgi:hypothetical protein